MEDEVSLVGRERRQLWQRRQKRKGERRRHTKHAHKHTSTSTVERLRLINMTPQDNKGQGCISPSVPEEDV